MGKLSAVLRSLEGGLVSYWCPGCDNPHAIKIGQGGGWTWDGNVDAPSFNPSILVCSGHYLAGHKGECWCEYNKSHPDNKMSFTCVRCHVWIRNGIISFLGDCSHAFAGQTIPIPPFPD